MTITINICDILVGMVIGMWCVKKWDIEGRVIRYMNKKRNERRR